MPMPLIANRALAGRPERRRKQSAGPVVDIHRGRRPVDLSILEKRFQSALRQRASRTRQVIVEGRHPVLVRMEDCLVLVVGEHRREFEASAWELDRLAAISQVPVEVFMSLKHANADTIETVVKRLKLRIDAMPTGLCQEATRAIRTACRLLLAHGLARSGDLKDNAVLQFHASLRVAIDRLVTLATEHESQNLRSAIQQMQATLPSVPWERALCVNCTGRESGYRHIIEQIMETWLDEHPDAFCSPAHRVLRQQGRNDLEHALDLAASKLGSGKLGKALQAEPSTAGPRFFDTPMKVFAVD